MKKLLLILILISAFATAHTDKPEWTYAFYIKDGISDISKICKSYNNKKKCNISIFYNNSVTDCSKTKPSKADAKSFFTDVKKNSDSWKYIFAVSADSIDAVKTVGTLRPTLLILDVPDMGRLENLYNLNNLSPYISVFAANRMKENFDYAAFLDSVHSSAESAVQASVETVKKQAESKVEKTAFFAIETGDRFEGFVELFDSRAQCFDKKIDRFERIKPAVGHYTDATGAANIINRMLNKKLKPVIISSFSNSDGITGPLLYYPADKAELNKTKSAYMKSALHNKYPNWLEFLEVLHVK